MPVPSSRRSGRQVGRTTFRHSKRLRTTDDSDPDNIWLTKSVSSSQALSVQFLTNRPKMLRRSSFSFPASFRFHIKSRVYSTLKTRPSLLTVERVQSHQDSDV